MHAHGVDVGAVEQALVGGGVVALDPLDQLVLAKVFAAGLGLGLAAPGIGVGGNVGRNRRRKLWDGVDRGGLCGVRLDGERLCARGAQ
jgi:hypothetical protein